MQFPLSFGEISLWLAVTAIILLTTSELISQYHGKTKILINKKRLRTVSLIFALLCMFTVFIRIYLMVTS